VGGRVRADPDRLERLLASLLDNAVTHAHEDCLITVGQTGDGFYVADDGPGIPADEREEVLDAAYSTADEGTGFGLTIAREIAAAHGWDLAVTESDAGGARIEVTGVEIVE
jgi:signal transduction histidine kinase